MKKSNLHFAVQGLAEALSGLYGDGCIEIEDRTPADWQHNSGFEAGYAEGFQFGYVKSHELAGAAIIGLGAIRDNPDNSPEESVAAFIDSLDEKMREWIHEVRAYISNLDSEGRAAFCEAMMEHCRQVGEMKQSIKARLKR